MLIDVLVVDDEVDIRNLISDILKDEGFTPRVAANSSQVFAMLTEKVPSAIILDIWLQDSEIDGLSILEIVKQRFPLIPVIVISGHGTIETALNAIKMGAYDYLEKPFSHDKLIIILKRAYEVTKLKYENVNLKLKVNDKKELVGDSPVTMKHKADINRIALTASRVMIQGKIGSGKELAARLIHKQSKRAKGPFVVLSPVCMTTDKLNQELFRKLGRQEQDIIRPSILEVANNGTLYIDEVSSLPMSVQINLLKFLQDQVLEQSCGKLIKLDVRFITATTKPLQDEVNSKRFLEDLYYRLNVITLKVPSLQERKDDIPILVKYFIQQLSKFSGLKAREFAAETIATLQAYDWPSNIRQLRNVVEWILIMNPIYSYDHGIITPSMIPLEILTNKATITTPNNNFDIMSMPLREAREIFERQYLSAQMYRFNNNISKTSAFVGMERSALHRKLKLLNIHILNNQLEPSKDDDCSRKKVSL